jgi:hypothetical protein
MTHSQCGMQRDESKLAMSRMDPRDKIARQHGSVKEFLRRCGPSLFRLPSAR